MSEIRYAGAQDESDVESIVDITARAFNRGPWATPDAYGR